MKDPFKKRGRKPAVEDWKIDLSKWECRPLVFFDEVTLPSLNQLRLDLHELGATLASRYIKAWAYQELSEKSSSPKTRNYYTRTYPSLCFKLGGIFNDRPDGPSCTVREFMMKDQRKIHDFIIFHPELEWKIKRSLRFFHENLTKSIYERSGRIYQRFYKPYIEEFDKKDGEEPQDSIYKPKPKKDEQLCI